MSHGSIVRDIRQDLVAECRRLNAIRSRSITGEQAARFRLDRAAFEEYVLDYAAQNLGTGHDPFEELPAAFKRVLREIIQEAAAKEP
jgi:hypothetical protein